MDIQTKIVFYSSDRLSFRLRLCAVRFCNSQRNPRTAKWKSVFVFSIARPTELVGSSMMTI
jgi:hypothetical protein